MEKSSIDINFDFYSDAKGGDPDCTSPTLRRYHKMLWSKPLPSGRFFEVNDNIKGKYLCHNSDLGEFFFGSDAISHSYRNHKRKNWLTKQIQNEVDELFAKGSTIGAYILFPNNKIEGKHTINQARGVNRFIDDRFDLTLECIRLFYLEQRSPLFDALLRYKDFFDLFEDFIGYIHFFLLDDLLDAKDEIKFFLPFDNFQSRPGFSDINKYLVYKENVLSFIASRNQRIANFKDRN